MSQHSFSAYDSALLSDEGDLYSDDDDASTAYGEIRTNSLGEKIIPSAADRRAHHNALERKRRDHIKDSFTSLRDSVPSLQGEKVTASRAQILKKAAEYIQYMRKKNNNVQSDIDEIAKQNKMLEDQIRRMEKQKSGGGGGGMTNQALSSLFSASEVSTSYDISENSNGSSNSGLGGSSSLVAGGSPMAVAANASSSNGSSSSTAASAVSTAAVSIIKSNATALGNGNALKRQCVQAPNGTSGSLINGTVATVRTVTVKNGGTIIVQNPQHNKTLNNTPHVIYVTTTSGGAAKANGTNSPTTTTTTPSLACNLSL